jgi:uncharacterized repeat protein (TIGR03803 family)
MTNLGERRGWIPRKRSGATFATLSFAFILVLAVVATLSAQAQTFSVLYSFTGTPDGQYPFAGLVRDAKGSLYGTTYFGGASSYGTVFKVNSKDKESVLYSFAGGGYPYDALIDVKSQLYGTTYSGGTSDLGTVFKVNQSGKETVLHSFAGDPDGQYPLAGLAQDAKGNFYGVTTLGGSFGNGVVFKLDKTGKETLLYTFTGGVDGGVPLYYGSLVMDEAGNLYGTTQGGGAGYGTVFKVTGKGEETVLHSFTGPPDGAAPFAGLVRDARGNLYGTALGGSSGNGVVFKVDKTGKETVLYSFTGGADGGNPFENLALDAKGNLYGTTEVGGSSGLGTVFKVSNKGKETVLHSFTGGADGRIPFTALIWDTQGNLYGTTEQGVMLPAMPRMDVERYSSSSLDLRLQERSADLGVTHSYTQISQYLTCPRRYRHRYLVGRHSGDDSEQNLITLCTTCHAAVHSG